MQLLNTMSLLMHMPLTILPTTAIRIYLWAYAVAQLSFMTVCNFGEPLA